MQISQVRRFFAPGFVYDLSVIKASEFAYRSNLYMTCGLIFVLCLLSTSVYDTPFFLYWSLIFAAVRSYWMYLLWRLPDLVGRGLFLWMYFSLCVMLFVAAVSIVYCFAQDGPDMLALGLMGVIILALSTLSVRTDDLLLCATYSTVVLMSLFTMPVFRYLHGLPLDRTIFLSLLTTIAAVSFVALLGLVRTSRRELRLVREAEVSKQNLQSLGQLTGGVAHDFNNLLTIIKGNLDLHRELGGAADPDRAALLTEIQSAADRAAALTSQLLVYARNSTLTPERIDLVQVIDTARPLIQRLLPATHRLTVITPQTPIWAEVDEKNLSNVLLNLVTNARQAMDGGGDIKIVLESRPRPVSGHLANILPEGFFAVIAVLDTGSGIPRHLLHRVIEPYFTTKPTGQGTGLGLSMAMGFAEQSGGALDIISEIGVGTTVELWFPWAEQPAAERAND